MTCKIYTLANPSTNEVFYVGKTRSTLYARLHDHIHSSKFRCDSRVYKYIAANEFIPEIEVLDEINIDSAKDEKGRYYENYWYEQLKAWGCKLLNSNVPHKIFESQKVKLSSEEQSFLLQNLKWVPSIIEKFNIPVIYQVIRKIAQRGHGLKKHIHKTQQVISALSVFDKTRNDYSYRMRMVSLTDGELGLLSAKIKGKHKQAKNIIGINGHTLTRIIKTKRLRYDKYMTVLQYLK